MNGERFKSLLLYAAVGGLLLPPAAGAEETSKQVYNLEEIVVTDGNGIGAPGIEQTPTGTIIDVQSVPTISEPTSVVDLLTEQAIIDFRGESNLDPGVDSIYMRGFDATRFVTALDGMTIQKTGGRQSSNIVDYSTLPAFLIETVEILPGPHSALYDSKSIGGVLNFKTVAPRHHDSLQPEGRLVTSYETYNTQTHNAMLQGAVQDVTYDLACQKSSSDGYLRNNALDSDIVYGRFGYLLPADGFVALSGSFSDVDREPPVTNTGESYDPDYPEVESASFKSFQDPTWTSLSYAYRLNYEQDSPIGRLSGGAYTGKDNRVRSYYAQADDTEPISMDTDWWQNGAKIQDEYQWSNRHVTTLGFDIAELADNGSDDGEKLDRVDKKGSFLQHQLPILPSVDLRLGLRYEDVGVNVTNYGMIKGREDIIERDWDQLIPKSFTTWKMDQLASWLRDTSLSAGISKIWRAPDTHGDYNPQGKPAGAWLDPEHGIGYDLVLNRRLRGDVAFKMNYAFYDIEDFIANNSDYAQYSGSSAGSLRYSDYKINLEEVYRHGVDLELGGHVTDDLSFNLTYSWQIFDNQGEELAGETELDQLPEHQITAGLAYQLFEKTRLMLDYSYQSDETIEIYEEMDSDDPDDDYFSEELIVAHHLFDFGVQQLLYKSDRLLREASLKLYVNNIFNEEYIDSSGYPATDRTVGASLSMRF